MSKTSDLIARREAAVTSGLGHIHSIFAERAKKANALQTCARDKCLILLTCGTNGNVIRFLPPLTIER